MELHGGEVFRDLHGGMLLVGLCGGGVLPGGEESMDPELHGGEVFRDLHGGMLVGLCGGGVLPGVVNGEVLLLIDNCALLLSSARRSLIEKDDAIS